MQAIRHGTMLPSLQRKEIGTSELDPFRSSILGRGLPCQRFTSALAGRRASLGVGADGWSLPHGGLSPPILCQLSWRTPSWVSYGLMRRSNNTTPRQRGRVAKGALLGAPDFTLDMLLI